MNLHQYDSEPRFHLVPCLVYMFLRGTLCRHVYPPSPVLPHSSLAGLGLLYKENDLDLGLGLVSLRCLWGLGYYGGIARLWIFAGSFYFKKPRSFQVLRPQPGCPSLYKCAWIRRAFRPRLAP